MTKEIRQAFDMEKRCAQAVTDRESYLELRSRFDRDDWDYINTQYTQIKGSGTYCMVT
jgi:hypothetical protein